MSVDRSHRRGVLWALAVLLVAAIPLASYLRAELRQPVRKSSSGQSRELTITPPDVVVPGIRNLSYGRVQASGTVRHLDLEGGFWALTKPATDPASSQAEDVVVVVVNAEEIGLPALEGQDIALNGTLLEGASIRMAGPEMTAEEIIRPH